MGFLGARSMCFFLEPDIWVFQELESIDILEQELWFFLGDRSMNMR